jgi:hypothetical protein
VRKPHRACREAEMRLRGDVTHCVPRWCLLFNRSALFSRYVLNQCARRRRERSHPVVAGCALCDRPQATGAQGLTPSSVSTRRHLDFVERQLKEFGGDGTREALEWVRGNEPPQPALPSIVHGDLWPANVLMRRGERRLERRRGWRPRTRRRIRQGWARPHSSSVSAAATHPSGFDRGWRFDRAPLPRRVQRPASRRGRARSVLRSAPMSIRASDGDPLPHGGRKGGGADPPASVGQRREGLDKTLQFALRRFHPSAVRRGVGRGPPLLFGSGIGATRPVTNNHWSRLHHPSALAHASAPIDAQLAS